MTASGTFFLALLIVEPGLSQTYTINTAAGGGLPANIPAASASLGLVNGVAIDASGNLFIADAVYSIVLRRNIATGMLALIAGNGLHGFSGDNGPATSAQLSLDDEFLVDFDNSVTGIAIDSAGNIYIADPGNSCVRKVSQGVITTVAGNGTRGYSGDNGPATSAQLSAPQGVAVDSSGNLYIADNISFDGVIRKVSNGIITTVAGGGSYSANLGDNGPATSAYLSRTYGVAVDSSGNLYIADTYDNRIREVAGGVITTIAGTGGAQGFSGDNGPATTAELSLPFGVAVDVSGNIYVADTVNGRIRRITNGIITTVAGGGATLGDNGPATSANLGLPVAIAIDLAGDIFVAEDGFPGPGSNRVRKVSAGVITTVAGGGSSLGDNGPATGGQFFLPEAVSVDSEGDLYIADTYNQLVRKVSNGVITTVAGGGSSTGDNVAATAAILNGPQSLAVDANGNLYFADGTLIGTAGSVRLVANGVISTAISEAQLNGYTPTAIAVDPSGNLYVAATLLYGPTVVQELLNGTLTTVAGSVTSIELGTSVGGLAFDRSGSLYISDTYDFRVLKLSNGTASVVAGNGTYGFSGDTGAATSAQLSDIGGIAVDAAGNLYIDDWGNARIRKVSNGIITTIVGNGELGFGGDGGPALSALLDGPFGGVAVDSAGDVYIADSYNERIRVVQPPALQPPITYAINQTIGAGSVTGVIVTDGTIGTLSSTNILSYNVLVNDATYPPYNVTAGSNPDLFLSGSDLSATASQLLFNFSGAQGGLFGMLDPSGDFGVCFVAGGPGGCFTVLAPSSGAALRYAITSTLPPTFDTEFTSLSGTQVIGVSGSSLSSLQGGTSSNPVDLPSGSVAQVTGSIAGSGSQEYYAFSWSGGVFSATASITGTINTGASYVFSVGTTGSCNGQGSVTLNTANSFIGTISIANLPAGNYCVGIDADSSNDPTLTITLNTPVMGLAPSCAITGDATVGISDVQQMINEALGAAPPVNDLNGDGRVNVNDVQIVIDAALGQGCLTGSVSMAAHVRGVGSRLPADPKHKDR
jgi:sugar lactone lactonase YvrE